MRLWSCSPPFKSCDDSGKNSYDSDNGFGDYSSACIGIFYVVLCQTTKSWNCCHNTGSFLSAAVLLWHHIPQPPGSFYLKQNFCQSILPCIWEYEFLNISLYGLWNIVRKLYCKNNLVIFRFAPRNQLTNIIFVNIGIIYALELFSCYLGKLERS